MRTLFLLTFLFFSCESKIKIPKSNQDNDVTPLSLPNNFSYTSNLSNNNTEIPNLTFDHEGESMDYCLGSSSGNCDIIDWSNTTTNNINDSGLSLSDGTYFIQLKSKKGNQESDIVEVEFIIDTTPPSLVSALSLSSNLTNSSTNSPTISFTNPSDSDFNKTQYCIGTSNTTCDIQALSDTPSNNFSASGLSLVDGTYFVNIQSLDNIDNTSSFASESWTVDATNPDPVTALSAPDTASFSDTGTITFTASSSGDVNRYEYSIGTTSGDNNLVDWTSIGTSTNFSNSSLSLTGGNTYFVNVRTVDNVGNLSTVVTDSWTVDATNPDPVTALSAPDNGDTTSSGTITFTGSGSGDVNRYEYSIGTTSGDNNLVDWTSIGTSTSFTVTGLSLTTSSTYYANVRVIDNVGNPSSVVTDSWTVVTLPILGENLNFTGLGPYTNRDLKFTDMKIDSNGKIVVVGYIHTSSSSSTVSAQSEGFIMRLNQDLTYDTSFNSVGYRIVNGSTVRSQNDRFYDVQIDSNGDIWVGGVMASTDGTEDLQLSILKFNSDGSFDTTWSGDGIFINNDSGGLPDDGEIIQVDLAILSDGPLLIFGVDTSRPNFWKFTNSATLDTSFNGNGKASSATLFVAGNGTNHSMTMEHMITSSGDVLIYGELSDNTHYVSKINSDMTIDTSFDGDSVNLTSISGPNYITPQGGMDIDASNNIFLFTTEGGDGCIYNINSNGTTNNSFGTSGLFCYNGYGSFHDGVVNNDHFFTIGETLDFDSFSPIWIVTKINLDRSLDTSFDSDGWFEDSTLYDEIHLMKIKSLSNSKSIIFINYEDGVGSSDYKSRLQIINH